MASDSVYLRKYFEYNTSYFGAGNVHTCTLSKSSDNFSKGYDFSGRLSGGTNSCLIQRTSDNKYRVVSYGECLEKYLSVINNCVENEEHFIGIMNTCVELQTSIGFIIKSFSLAGQLFRITLFPIVHTNLTTIIANISPVSKSDSNSDDGGNVTVGNCVIGLNKEGFRIFKSVSPGFTNFFDTSSVSPKDILYCRAVNVCLTTMSRSECELRVDYGEGVVKSFSVTAVPYRGENSSLNAVLTIIPSANAVSPDTSDTSKNITEREQEVINLAAKGCTNKYIAHKLLITEGTVKKTLHNAYKKLGIKSRMELIRLLND